MQINQNLTSQLKIKCEKQELFWNNKYTISKKELYVVVLQIQVIYAYSYFIIFPYAILKLNHKWISIVGITLD